MNSVQSSTTSQNVIERPLYFTVYMGGKWNDINKNEAIAYEDFNRLAHSDLCYSTSSKIYNIHRKHRKEMISLNEVGIYEHYYADLKYFHLLFDVDEIKTEEEYIEAVEYFNALSVHLGDYSIAEYTSDVYLSETYNIPLIPGAKKYYSAHIVFYTRKIHIDLIKDLFKTAKIGGSNRFVNEGIKYQDISIWEPLLRGKGRLMRVAISNKISGSWDSTEGRMSWEPVKNTATIVTDKDKKPLPNTTNLITMSDLEVEVLESITKDDLEACGIVFKDIPQKVTATVSMRKVGNRLQNISKATFDKIEVNDRWISISYEQLDEILSDVHAEDGSVEFQLGEYVASLLAGNAAHIFTDPQRLADSLTNWYNGPRIHTNSESMAGYVTSYYNTDIFPNNYWFTKLLDKIPDEDKRKHWSDMYGRDLVNDDLTVNAYTPADQFYIEYVLNHTYNVSQEIEDINEDGVNMKRIKLHLTGFYDLINDLKRCVAFVNGVWYIKTRNPLSPSVYVTKTKQQLVDEYIQRPFGTSVDICLYAIILKYSNYFTYTEVVSCNEEAFNRMPKKDDWGNPVKRFNMFVGFNAIDVPNEESAKYLHDLLYNICNLDDAETDEVTCRISWILRNLTHSDVVEVFQGQDGAGKGTLLKIINSFARQYIRKVGKIDDIVCGQNSIIEGAYFVFINELARFSDNRIDAWNSFKDSVDGDYVMIADKYVRKHMVPNTNNFFIFTNNINSIPLTSSDRRTNIHNTGLQYPEGDVFWTRINDMIKEKTYINGFYSYLYHYLDDKPDYNPRKVMKTDAREDAITATTNQYETYVKETPEIYAALTAGLKDPRVSIKELLSDHVPSNISGWTPKQLTKWASEIRKLLVQVKSKGERTYILPPKLVEQLRPDNYAEPNDDIDFSQ